MADDKLEQLAIDDPQAYVDSNPSSREWNLSAPELSKVISYDPIKTFATQEQLEPTKWGWFKTVGKGIENGIVQGAIDVADSINVAGATSLWTSANMTKEEADRLLKDALYTRHYSNRIRNEDISKKINYSDTYEFSNAIGNMIKYVGTGIATGGTGVVAIVAGAESAAGLESDLTDRFIEEHGDLSEYTRGERYKDLALSGTYGVFSGLVESALGVERIATGGLVHNADVLSRAMRMAGKGELATAVNVGRHFAQGAIGEGTEEFIQSLGEDGAIALAGYSNQLSLDETFSKALKSAMYGAILGGPVGAGLYFGNRKVLITKLNNWQEKAQLNLSENEVIQIADSMLDNGKSQMLEEITTRAELKNGFGQAIDAMAERIKAQIIATGKTIENLDAYAHEVAKSAVIPAYNLSARSGLPLSTFLEVADFTVVNNVAYFKPIRDIKEVKAKIDEQKGIIKQERENAKLGTENQARLADAQRRLAVLNNLHNVLHVEQANKKEKRVANAETVQKAIQDIVNLTGVLQAGKSYENALIAWIADGDSVKTERLLVDIKVPHKILEIIKANAEQILRLAKAYPGIDLQSDLYNTIDKLQRADKDNFVDITQEQNLDGKDVLAENIFTYMLLFADTETNKQFFKSYLDILENNRNSVLDGQDEFGNKVAPLSKKDALGQALKRADEYRATLSASKGRKYESLFAENGEIKDINLKAAFISYQNQFNVAPESETLNQSAYAGSRVDYDKPSLEALGTGEGNQAHGWGLYYALAKNVADDYRFAFTKKNEKYSIAQQFLFGERINGFDRENTIQRLKTVIEDAQRRYDTDDYFPERGNTKESWKKYLDNLRGALEIIKNESLTYDNFVNKDGQVVEVDIPEMDVLLDEQKAFSEQSALVQNVLNKITEEFGIKTKGKRQVGVDFVDITGKYVYSHLSDKLGSPKKASEWLDKNGIKGITYDGREDGRCFVIFNENSVKVLRKKFDEFGNVLFQNRQMPNGWYDPELSAIVLTKNWNTMTLPHEIHHYYLAKIIDIYNQAQGGTLQVEQTFLEDIKALLADLGIENPQSATARQITVAQEKFASMTEAYLTGLGVQDTNSITYRNFLNWVPEKYKSIMNIGYLDANNKIVNPLLDDDAVRFFNKWFESPNLPTLPSAPKAQNLVNPTDDKGEVIPSSQKEMNNREKEFGQDAGEQERADKALYTAIDENVPSDLRAGMDGAKIVSEEPVEDGTVLPKAKERERWYKPRQKNAQEIAAEKAREYVAKNKEHAIELALADPEISTYYDAPVDRAMLIMAVMEITDKNSPDYAILYDNLATYRSMSGSALGLTNNISQSAYLDAKHEINEAKELKAVINYAGRGKSSWDKWRSDISKFIQARVASIIATEPNSKERTKALKAFLEEAKTKFSANTTDSEILNQLDLTGVKTRQKEAFIKWAEKAIRQVSGASMSAKEEQEIIVASQKAQNALLAIDNPDIAIASNAAKDIREWQLIKNKMIRANWGMLRKLGHGVDWLFGTWGPTAMLMSVNTLFVANLPSTAINNKVIKSSMRGIYKDNVVSQDVMDKEAKRIKGIFRASGMNIAQMEKPTSPSLLHGEKYENVNQNFVFNTLAWGDNLFRIPTFVETLARIASKNANGDKAKAEQLFREYSQLNTNSDEAKLARKQALAVSNMAVFTQDGMLSNSLNHARSIINTVSRGIFGLSPKGFGLGNILAPFLKTGANIVEMGVKGTIAPIRQIAMGLRKLQGQQIPEIDRLSMRADWINFSITALSIALLAALSSDDDDWYTEPYTTGRRYDPEKPYDSIKIGGVWVKLDMFGALAIPLRTGALLIKEKNVGNALLSSGGQALGETPLVSEIINNNLDYATRKPGQWISGFAYNQANKLIPAQLKSLSKAGSHAFDWELDVGSGYLGKKFHRNYGLDGRDLTNNELINTITNRIKTEE